MDDILWVHKNAQKLWCSKRPVLEFTNILIYLCTIIVHKMIVNVNWCISKFFTTAQLFFVSTWPYSNRLWSFYLLNQVLCSLFIKWIAQYIKPTRQHWKNKKLPGPPGPRNVRDVPNVNYDIPGMGLAQWPYPRPHQTFRAVSGNEEKQRT